MVNYDVGEAEDKGPSFVWRKKRIGKNGKPM